MFLSKSNIGARLLSCLILLGTAFSLCGFVANSAATASVLLRSALGPEWQFTNGPEFPGASGNFTIDQQVLRNDQATGVLTADFSAGGNYVGIRCQSLEANTQKMSVDVLSNARLLGVLIHDASGEMHFFELPLSGDASVWQTVTLDFTDSKLKPKASAGGDNDGKIQVPVRDLMFRVSPQSDRLKTITRLGNLQFGTAESSVSTSRVVQADAPGAFFFETEPLRFKLSAVFPKMRYQVTSWRGELLISSELPEGAESFLLPQLKRGFYELKLVADGVEITGSRSFAVVVDPATRKKGLSHPYSMDVAAIFIPSVKGLDGYRLFAELIRRAGAEVIRDRIGWHEVELTKGAFTFGPFDEYQKVLAEFGIKSSVTNHTAPRWAQADDKATLPNNPLDVYQFMRKLAERYGEQVVWEFWNEQDLIFFSHEPAWDFATMMKAAYLGIKAATPGQAVLPGAFCAPIDSGYNRTAMASGLSSYFDIFNNHIYDPLHKYPELVTALNSFLSDYGIPNMPIWITENGTRSEGPARIETRRPGYKEHSNEQEMIQTEFVVKSQILLQSLGVSRNFTFVLPPYFEGDGAKSWGLVREDYTAKPALAAFATLTAELGGARYLGEVSLPKGLRGFVFLQEDGTQSLIYWSESELDLDDDHKYGWSPEKPFLLNFTLAAKQPARLVDVFGTVQVLIPKSGLLELSANRYPQYLHGLNDLRIAKAAPLSRVAGARAVPLEKSIVMQLVLAKSERLQYDSFQRDALWINKKLEANDLLLRVWNLGEKKQRGRVELLQGAIAGTLPESMEIEAFGYKDIYFSLPSTAKRLTETYLIGGRFNQLPISPLAFPVIRRDRIVPGESKALLNAKNPNAWSKNSSAEELIIRKGEGEGAVRFDATFAAGIDRWIYPAITVPTPEKTLKDAIAIEFEIKSEQSAHTRVVMFTDEDTPKKQNTYVSFDFTVGEWTKCSVGIPNGIKKISSLQIGLNPGTLKASYQLRNISIRYGAFQPGGAFGNK